MLQHFVPIVFTILFGGLIFYLLRKKIIAIENKVNLMFQLIQEHEKKEQLRNTSQQTSNSQTLNNNLIDVSDVDNDSVEESESDDNEITDDLHSTENSKQIAMNLINQIDNNLNMTKGMRQSNNNDSDTDDDSDYESDDTDNDSDKLNIQGSIESLEQNKIISLNVDDNNSLPESISVTEIKNVSKTTDNNSNNTTLDENTEVIDNLNSENVNNLDSVHANNKDVGNSDLDDVNLDDESNDESHNFNNKKNNTILKNYTVSELKKECSKRNLSNFKSLKKNDLIELLENS